MKDVSDLMLIANALWEISTTLKAITGKQARFDQNMEFVLAKLDAILAAIEPPTQKKGNYIG